MLCRDHEGGGGACHELRPLPDDKRGVPKAAAEPLYPGNAGSPCEKGAALSS